MRPVLLRRGKKYDENTDKVPESYAEVLLNVQGSLRRIIRWMLRGIDRVCHFYFSLFTQFSQFTIFHTSRFDNEQLK